MAVDPNPPNPHDPTTEPHEPVAPHDPPPKRKPPFKMARLDDPNKDPDYYWPECPFGSGKKPTPEAQS